MSGVKSIVADSRWRVLLVRGWIACSALMMMLGGIHAWHSGEAWAWLALAVLIAGLPILYARITLDWTRIDGRLRRIHGQQALELAERYAGIGRWRYDHRRDIQSWSSGLCSEHQLRSGLAPDAGIRSVLANHLEDREPFHFEVEVGEDDDEPCVLRVFARNFFSHSGELHETFGVVINVTQDYQRLRVVSDARTAAVHEAERAKELANTDALTGLANRRKAMAAIDKAIVDARETREALSLIVFDIDHFKQINDQHGHPAGDAVLRRVAKIAKAHTRDEDLVARIGGEEFLWLIPGVGGSAASLAAERLRLAIFSGTAIANAETAVTISLGMAICMPGDSSLTLFARADDALYEAKNSGRNQLRRAA